MSITVLVGNERLCELSIDTTVAHMIEVKNITDPLTEKKAVENIRTNMYSAYRDCEGHLTKNEVTKALVDGEASK